MTNHDVYLYNALEKLIKYPMSLEYKYNMRNYIHKYNVTPETDSLGILPLVNSGHLWYFSNLEKISKVRNLRVLLSLCDGSIKKFGHPSDDLVLLLSKVFNNTIESTRSLIDCYDCGTVARAVFLVLLQINRGKIILYAPEIARLQNMYTLTGKSDNVSIIKQCKKFITTQDSECVFICSINLNLSGHVFILEKTFEHNVAKYHIYQTCLNAYTLLDYVEQQNYASEKSICINVFFDSLVKLYECPVWEYNENLIFTELFSYLPNHSIEQSKKPFEFSWSYVIY